MTVNLYLDMEFTGLHQHTTPVSLGIVDDNGEYFYAEFTDYDDTQVDGWIRDNVLSNTMMHLGISPSSYNPGFINGPGKVVIGTQEEVAQALREWIPQQDLVQIVGDVSAYDWVLFCELFGGALSIPGNVCPAPLDINQMLADERGISYFEAFDLNREEFADLPLLAKHSALWDAFVVRSCYRAINPRRDDLIRYSFVDENGQEIGYYYGLPVVIKEFEWKEKEEA